MVKEVKDYVKQVQEQHPDLTEDEIKRILNYGFKMILQYLSTGNDIFVNHKNFFCFIGKIPKNPLDVFQRYCYKLAKRIRFMFKRTNSEWDGYYYFALSEKQYLKYLMQYKRKTKSFEYITIYRLLEECKIREHAAPYIFRLNDVGTSRFRKFYQILKTKSVELIIQRDALQMKDILTSQNKFKYIQ